MAKPWRRPETGVYYLRERVPAAVAEKARGRILVFRIDGATRTTKVGEGVKMSLGTKDTPTAKARYRVASATLQEYWTQIEQETETGPLRLTQRQTDALAGEYYHAQTRQHQDEPGNPEDWDAGLSALHDMAATTEKLERLHGEDADKLLCQRGKSIDADSRLKLLEAMHRAYVWFTETQVRRGLGDYSPDERAERFPEFSDGGGTSAGPDTRSTVDAPRATLKRLPDTSLSDLFELWAKEHRKAGGPEKSVKDFRQKLDSLRTHLGHDDAAAATQRDVIEWCDHLQEVDKLSAKTVGDKYLTAARAVFNVGVEKGRLATAPTAGVKVRKPKRIKVRPSGFTDDEAEAILTAALRDPGTLGNMAGKNKLAIRWTPWLGAYTGARITELTQLRRQDFIVISGIPCIRITPEAGSVKNGQYRVVPLHPHLIEMGLLDFVAAQPEGYLNANPGQTLEETRTRCGNAGQKVSGWVRDVAGVTDRRVQPTHGWRHRFKTMATVVDIAPEYADMIQGHSRGDAASVYREPDMVALYREIQKLPRFEWPEEEGVEG